MNLKRILKPAMVTTAFIVVLYTIGSQEEKINELEKQLASKERGLRILQRVMTQNVDILTPEQMNVVYHLMRDEIEFEKIIDKS